MWRVNTMSTLTDPDGRVDVKTRRLTGVTMSEAVRMNRLRCQFGPCVLWESHKRDAEGIIIRYWRRTWTHRVDGWTLSETIWGSWEG